MNIINCADNYLNITTTSEGFMCSCDTEDWSNDDENSALSSQDYFTF